MRRREGRMSSSNESPLPCRLGCRPRADAAARRSWGQPRLGIACQRREQPRQRSGRAALPDAQVRASKTERQSESEPVSEAPLSVMAAPNLADTGRGQQRDRPVDWRLAPRPDVLGRGGRGETASAPRMRCRGKAGCRPGQTDHGEHGKRPGRERLLVAAGQARCPLMRTGRGGVRVVVRGRESRPHGEGGQQDRSVRSRSGGRA